MSVARLMIVAVALVAAISAGLLALNLSSKKEEPVVITAEPAQPPIKLADVLVAERDIAMGEPVEGALGWQKWPEEGLNDTLIAKANEPDAIENLAGAKARQAFFAGEPVRTDKLISSDEGFLSAILPTGKRAVAVRISADTSAGGFILPNDHVDVIMTRRLDNQDPKVAPVSTETVLRNIRVLAIDQSVEEEQGEKVVVGSTATLEVDPEQAEALSAAQQIADTLILSLRSLADSVPGTPGYARFLLAKENAETGKVKLVRYGRSSEITTPAK